MSAVTASEEQSTTPPVKINPLLNLLAQDASYALLSFLTPRCVLELAAVSRPSAAFVGAPKSPAEAFWTTALAKDFKYVDKQNNRSRGYYRSMYLSLLEDQVGTDNLLTGGH